MRAPLRYPGLRLHPLLPLPTVLIPQITTPPPPPHALVPVSHRSLTSPPRYLIIRSLGSREARDVRRLRFGGMAQMRITFGARADVAMQVRLVFSSALFIFPFSHMLS
jgi:hypothetical protein